MNRIDFEALPIQQKIRLLKLHRSELRSELAEVKAKKEREVLLTVVSELEDQLHNYWGMSSIPERPELDGYAPKSQCSVIKKHIKALKFFIKHEELKSTYSRLQDDITNLSHALQDAGEDVPVRPDLGTTGC